MLIALITIAVLLTLILAALGLLMRRAYSVDPIYVIAQLDEAIAAIRDDIVACRGLTDRDVTLLAGLLRIGRRQVINDVLPRLRAICSALDIDDREDFEKRSSEERAMVAAMGAELTACAQGKK